MVIIDSILFDCNKKGHHMKLSAGLFALSIGLSVGLTNTQFANANTTTTPSSNIAANTATIEQSTAKTTQTGDAIQQFVVSDFAARKAMLERWPASVAEFDQLVAYIDANELYTDATGQTLILKNDTELLQYPALQAAPSWPPSLKQVTLTNTLRQALNIGQAKAKLASADPKQRLAAIAIFESDLTQVDPAVLNAALAKEQDASVLLGLQQLQAQLDLNSPDLATQQKAVAVLANSSHPEILSLLQAKLAEPNLDPTLKKALTEASASIQSKIKTSEWVGHLFSGLSMASILLLAALGLAITYGLLGVINMAHGELIMIGAYTTYVVQGLFKSYFAAHVDWYLIAAIPAAFMVSAIIGMLIERIVVRPLYGRQLETLLATFGVSLILMQVVRMTFGAQNVEVSNISWLSGGMALTPSLVLPYSRMAIIAFTVTILLLLVFLISKTRFGLFVRAVTQNRQMARSVGIRSARVDMMAFGLGSGLAGLAGCALAQIGNVGPDLGQTYIIDTFLVVVVGGVGQIMGAVLAALGLGIGGTFLEVGMGAVLAKICLLVLIILFIQKRPQGLFAIKGRFVD
jgi:urea transport system permease protein